MRKTTVGERVKPLRESQEKVDSKIQEIEKARTSHLDRLRSCFAPLAKTPLEAFYEAIIEDKTYYL